MKNKNLPYIAEAAVIAALYLLLYLPLKPIAFGPVQFRISEALAVLPALSSAAIPGIFIGCFLANITTGAWVDMVFGSSATLLAAFLTRFLAKKLGLSESAGYSSRKELLKRPGFYSLPLPTIIINALIVGSYLTLIFSDQAFSWLLLAQNIFFLALSEALVLYLFALPLYATLQPFYAERAGKIGKAK